jgi:hypothetical protein
MAATHYDLAYEAIEEFVAGNHPDESGAWLEIVPTGPWGYTLNGWESAASDIVANFNRRLPPEAQIKMSAQTKRKTAQAPLIDFQRLLAAMADAAISAAAVEAIRQALGL